jgi:hypothetical protein
VIAAPYLGKTPRALADKLKVLEREGNRVVAAHFTPVFGGRRRARTIEAVTFTPPSLIEFELLDGPVRGVAETFELAAAGDGTQFTWQGQLDSRFAPWGAFVARKWTAAVRESLDGIAAESERRAG